MLARRCLVLLVAGLLLASASAQGLGSRAACVARRPSAPTSLKYSVASEGSVSLGWEAGTGAVAEATRPCTSGFEIRVYSSQQGTKTFISQVPSAVITGMIPSESYTIEVRALSSRALPASEPAVLSGVRPTAASTAAKGLVGAAGGEGWSCLPQQGYPVCSAGRAGLCSPNTCAEMASLGRCSAPFLRVQDWERRTITQHCAAECGGCSGPAAATPRLQDQLAPPHEYCCSFGAGQYFQGAGGAAVADVTAEF